MKQYRGIIILVAVIAVVIIIYMFSGNKKHEESVNGFVGDYDGDEYDGTSSYMGDKNSYTRFKGRSSGHARPDTLFKVLQPTNINKFEHNAKGVKRMMKTDRIFNKGAQVRVFQDSISKPQMLENTPFVETISGHFVRLDRLKRV